MSNTTYQTVIKDIVTLGQDVSTQNLLFHRALALRLHLPATDLHCMEIIARSPALTPSDLGRKCGLTSGATTALLDRLEEKGLIMRVADPHDRRRVIITYAESAFNEEWKALTESYAMRWKTVFEQYDTDNLKLLRGFLESILALLEEETTKLDGTTVNRQQ